MRPHRSVAPAVATAVASAASDAVDTAIGLSPSYYAAELALEDAGVIGGMRDPDAALAPAAGGTPVTGWLNALPSLAQLDVLTYRVVAVGLPLLTLGIITGAMWAREAWGAYWQWDPKETAALFSWIIYAIYMHLHTRNAWRGLRTSWVSVIGFASIIFCYLGVNIWISGLHSYKM
jgi:cytochrome c-type biogenesis protein CcsB